MFIVNLFNKLFFFLKKFKKISFSTLLSFFLIPSWASAADSINYEKDLAIGVLGKIFGPLINVGGKVAPETVFSEQIVYFVPIASMIALTISGIMVYFKAVGAASGGKLFDQAKASSAMHLRVVAGLSFLVPDKYGFPVIQKVFMWFIIKGLSMANLLWFQIVDNYQIGNLLNNEGSVPLQIEGVSDYDLDNFMKVIIHACLKARYEQLYLGLESIAFFEGENDFKLETVPSVSTQSLQPWVFNFSGEKEDKKKEKDLKIYNETKSFLLNFTNELLTSPFIESLGRHLYENKNLGEDFSGLNYDETFLKSWYRDQKERLKNTLIRSKADPESNQEKLLVSMRDGGWFLAGSFYWKLQSLEKNNASTGQFVQLVSQNHLVTITEGKDIEETNRIRKINNFLQKIISSKGLKENNFREVEDNSSALDFSFKGVFDSKASDPLLAFILYCQNKIVSMINFLQGLALGSMATAILLFVLKPSILPGAQTAIFLGFTLFTFCSSILALILAPLLMGSLYIPFLPFLIFFVGVLIWLIKVIEAILAAPIIAVALIEPSDDDFGRASQSGVMLLNVAFRPLLMMVGFIFSARLIGIALTFVGTSLMSLDLAFSDVTPLGLMMWEMASLGIIVAIVQALVSRSFSLIYLLPDKVFSWIGLRADQSDSKALIQDVQEGMQEGIRNIEGIFKLANVLQQTVNNSRKENNSNNSGKENNKD